MYKKLRKSKKEHLKLNLKVQEKMPKLEKVHQKC